ncbi:MAG: small multidrug resistance protein [Elusimicrobiota bacterium]|jgi:small multidrug resistance pump|nr:small multidrug resistance protein [Elusimicrobiota bacterium]
MDKTGILFLLSSAITNAIANGFLKTAFAGNANIFGDGLIKGLIKIAANPYAVLGAILFGVSFLFFGSALARVNLSSAYPFMAGTAFLLIFLISALFFKEQINIWSAFGAFCIISGIILISVKG